LQKEQELNELENLKAAEIDKRKAIEREKERLIKENEEILKSYFSKGYFKSLADLEKNAPVY
jgi:hypothetical protein